MSPLTFIAGPWRRFAPAPPPLKPLPPVSQRPAAEQDLAAQLATAQMQLKGSLARSGRLNVELANADRARKTAESRVEELELVRDALAAQLDAYETGHAVACGHAAEVAKQRQLNVVLQRTLDEYQQREEARDRAHDREHSFIPEQRSRRAL